MKKMTGKTFFANLLSLTAALSAVALLSMALSAVVLPAVAAANSMTADEILDQMEGNTSLTGSGTAAIELVTINRRGQERVNQLRIYRHDGADGAKQLLEYLTPADVAGTKFLSIEEGDETNMWLYLPALGRERRIAGSATDESFMGTDFTFEEIGDAGQFSADYDGERLDDETYDGLDTYVLRLTPAENGSKYSFVKMWVWQEHFIPLRIEFFNQQGQLEKTLHNDELRQNAQGEWQPHRITMSNEVSGSKTIIRLLEIEESEVPEDYFTLRYLRR